MFWTSTSTKHIIIRLNNLSATKRVYTKGSLPDPVYHWRSIKIDFAHKTRCVRYPEQLGPILYAQIQCPIRFPHTRHPLTTFIIEFPKQIHFIRSKWSRNIMTIHSIFWFYSRRILMSSTNEEYMSQFTHALMTSLLHDGIKCYSAPNLSSARPVRSQPLFRPRIAGKEAYDPLVTDRIRRTQKDSNQRGILTGTQDVTFENLPSVHTSLVTWLHLFPQLSTTQLLPLSLLQFPFVPLWNVCGHWDCWPRRRGLTYHQGDKRLQQTDVPDFCRWPRLCRRLLAAKVQ